jgi:hypothetical protein
MAINTTDKITSRFVAGTRTIKSESAILIQEEKATSGHKKTKRVSAFFSLSTTLANFAKRLGPFLVSDTSLLSMVPYLSTAISSLAVIFHIIVSVTSAKGVHLSSFMIKSSLSISTSALDISALIVKDVAYPLAIASAGVCVIKNLWDVSEELYSYFKGNWAKEKLRFLTLENTYSPDQRVLIESSNKLRAHLKGLAEATHTLTLSMITLIGSCMMLTHYASLGLILMASVTAYTVIDNFKLNSLRLLANKVFDYPFKELTLQPEISLNTSDTHILKVLNSDKSVSELVTSLKEKSETKKSPLQATTLPFEEIEIDDNYSTSLRAQRSNPELR